MRSTHIATSEPYDPARERGTHPDDEMYARWRAEQARELDAAFCEWQWLRPSELAQDFEAWRRARSHTRHPASGVSDTFAEPATSGVTFTTGAADGSVAGLTTTSGSRQVAPDDREPRR